MTLLQFYPPADNQRGPTFLEPLIEGWVSLAGKEGIRLGIGCEKGQLVFLIDAPSNRQRIFAAQLENAFPGGKATVISQPTVLPHKTKTWLRLSPDVYPLKLHEAFIEQHTRDPLDPLQGLFELVKSGRSGRVSTTFWLEIKPLKKKQLARAKHNAKWLNEDFRLKAISDAFEKGFSDSRWHQRLKLLFIRALTSRAQTLPDEVADKLVQPLLSASIFVEIQTDALANQLHEQRLLDMQSALTLFTSPCSFFTIERHSKSSFLLASPEIASMWHFPTPENVVPRLEQNVFKELEPPANLPRPGDDPNVVTLGRVCFRNERFKFGMDLEARRRHLWCLGKTGMGKTTFLQGIIKQDLEAGRGFAVIEPHGDLAENTIRMVPKYRKNDIVYFDPADEQSRVTFNPLYVPPGSDKTLIADGVLTSFQKVFGFDESQAPRMLHIFRNSLLSLVEMPNATLMDVQRVLVEDMYRKSVVARVENPVVRSFWLDEFGKWKPYDRTAFIASLQNKLGAFLTNPKLQRVLGDPKAKLDLRRIMDEGKVLIVNLSKGRLGENASNLLGTLIVTSLQLAAMSRANIPEQERRDFSIIVDEFQNAATPSIATFLSEARKYRTHLILANQYTQQIPEDILAAIFGNVGSQIVFQLGVSDSEILEAQFGHSVHAASLQQTPPFHAYCRLHSRGVQSPFSIQTIPTR